MRHVRLAVTDMDMDHNRLEENKLENVQIDLLEVYLSNCLIWVWVKQ